MQLSARIHNHKGTHQVVLSSGDRTHELVIPPKASGFGSSVSGGEALFLALATCYCNDVYREAEKRGIQIESVDVEVQGDFPSEGAPAENVVYHASVKADAPEEAILDLMRHTDTVAEIQNSVRAATPVTLVELHVVEG